MRISSTLGMTTRCHRAAAQTPTCMTTHILHLRLLAEIRIFMCDKMKACTIAARLKLAQVTITIHVTRPTARCATFAFAQRTNVSQSSARSNWAYHILLTSRGRGLNVNIAAAGRRFIGSGCRLVNAVRSHTTQMRVQSEHAHACCRQSGTC